jgi:hypothetical protein
LNAAPPKVKGCPMMMPEIFYLLGAALVPLAFYFLSVRNSSRSGGEELGHAIETLPRIRAQLTKLLESPDEARIPLCMAIVKQMRDDCFLLTFVTYQRLRCALQPTGPKKLADSRHPAFSSFARMRRLERHLRRVLVLARNRPNRVTGGRHLAYAAVHHNLLWLEYLRFLQALYPESYQQLVLPDDAPLPMARSA